MYVLLAPVGLTKGRCVCFTGSSWFDQGEVCMFYWIPVGLTKGRCVCFTGSSWFDQGEVCMFYWLQLV